MKLRATNFRKEMSEEIFGQVMELGPGQITFPTPNAANVVLVDKLPSDLHKELFPELGKDVHIVEPDHLVDFDSEGLIFAKDKSYDFIVASHLLEHLAQPFRMLDEIHRVLRSGGKALIFLPDRRRTFDRTRKIAPLEHFLNEYSLGNPEVSDEDLFDFLENTENYFERNRMTDFSQLHLARSIHVHAWTDNEFIKLLSEMQRVAYFNFKVVGGVSSSVNIELEEFGFVLEKIDLEGQRNPEKDILENWQHFQLLAGPQNRLKIIILNFVPASFHPMLVNINRKLRHLWE